MVIETKILLLISNSKDIQHVINHKYLKSLVNPYSWWWSKDSPITIVYIYLIRGKIMPKISQFYLEHTMRLPHLLGAFRWLSVCSYNLSHCFRFEKETFHITILEISSWCWQSVLYSNQDILLSILGVWSRFDSIRWLDGSVLLAPHPIFSWYRCSDLMIRTSKSI